ncbi:MAG: Opr family porin, partial [Aliarcobacter sp.]|nr:Opr family porin [Aliarcobacter sp.]
DVGSDGSVGHVELNTVISGVSAAIGYIKTDKDAGVASIADFGDSLSPFDTGNYVFSTDAKTAYGTLGYSIAGVDLGLVYGQTTYSSLDDKEKELNLTASYTITKSLSTSLLYANIDAQSNDDDNNYASVTVEYTF